MSHVFISYARSTANEAQAVATALRGLGREVWLDDEIPAHRAYADVIEERLREAKAVVVIWSAEAVRSEWVRSEADRARGDRKLVQLSVDGAPLPMPFDQIQCADLAGWTGDLDAPGWRKVAASVAELMSGVAPSNASAAARPARQHSICVLPFSNMSGDTEQEYFSDGISEDIITDLSKVSSLFVVARHSAFAFKGMNVDLREVAGKLGVTHVLEGSVRKAGGRVRITAQLTDGATGGAVWAERYDRDLDDIFALQDEISQAIVRALRARLLPAERSAIQQRGTTDVEAYDLYLMAREYLASGNHGDARMAEAVVSLCRRATLIDPEYARAWALMAVAQTKLHFVGGKPDDGLEAAERALSLDATLAEAHAVKARHLFRLGRSEESAAEIDLALRLDPDSFEVNSSAGSLSFRQGKWKDAIGHHEKATALLDTAFGPPTALIGCYVAIGDNDGVRRAAETTVARAERALMQDRTNGSAISSVVYALAALGEGERARDWSRRALLLDPDNQEMRYSIACSFCAFLKDASAALELLGPYIATARPNDLAWIKLDPDMDQLREDPRFQTMMADAEKRLAEAASQTNEEMPRA